METNLLSRSPRSQSEALGMPVAGETPFRGKGGLGRAHNPRKRPTERSTDLQSVGQAVVPTAAFGDSGRDDRQPHRLQVCATEQAMRDNSSIFREQPEVFVSGHLNRWEIILDDKPRSVSRALVTGLFQHLIKGSRAGATCHKPAHRFVHRQPRGLRVWSRTRHIQRHRVRHKLRALFPNLNGVVDLHVRHLPTNAAMKKATFFPRSQSEALGMPVAVETPFRGGGGLGRAHNSRRPPCNGIAPQSAFPKPHFGNEEGIAAFPRNRRFAR